MHSYFESLIVSLYFAAWRNLWSGANPAVKDPRYHPVSVRLSFPGLFYMDVQRIYACVYIGVCMCSFMLPKGQ